MPKYMITSSYTPQGAAGLLKDGGTKRRQAVEKLASDAGGKVESFYFAFGGDDVIVIFDMPDAATMTAASLNIGAAGAISVKTTVLVTPEEVDAATQKPINYQPPGS